MENVIKTYNFKKINESLLRINNAIGIPGYFVYKAYGINRDSLNKKTITHVFFELSCEFNGKDLLTMVDTNSNEKFTTRKKSFENNVIDFLLKIIFLNGYFLTNNNKFMKFDELVDEIILNKVNFYLKNKK